MLPEELDFFVDELDFFSTGLLPLDDDFGLLVVTFLVEPPLLPDDLLRSTLGVLVEGEPLFPDDFRFSTLGVCLGVELLPPDLIVPLVLRRDDVPLDFLRVMEPDPEDLPLRLPCSTEPPDPDDLLDLPVRPWQGWHHSRLTVENTYGGAVAGRTAIRCSRRNLISTG